MSKTHNAGIVTAYGAAVRGGYTGTYEEFCAQQAEYAKNARDMKQAVSDAKAIKESVESAVSAAETHANNANQSATNASNSATQASGFASNANQSAESASQSATNASNSATQASGFASNANQSAESASQFADNASNSADDARQSAEDAASVLSNVYTKSEIDSTIKQKLINAFPTDSATGTIVSFNDGADDIPVKNLTVNIEPIQDLHGYDRPWIAGAGKNLFNKNNFSSFKGYFNNDTKKVVSSSAHTIVYMPCEPDTYYTVSRLKTVSNERFAVGYSSEKPSNGSTIIAMTDVAAPSGAVGTVMKKTVKTTEDATYLLVWAWWDSSVNAKDSLQIEVGSTATDYEPYENVCPIYGWTGAKVVHVGRNLWDEEWELGNINSSTGAPLNDTRFIRSKNYIPVKPNTIYHSTLADNGYYFGYDYNKNFIGRIYITNAIPSNCFYMKFQTKESYGTEYKNDISINYPATDNEYHPHYNETINIDWTDEAGEVFGGMLDVVTGVLTKTHEFSELSVSGWSSSGANFWRNNPGMSLSTPAKIGYCSHYPCATDIAGNGVIIFGKAGFSTVSRFVIRDNNFATVSDLEAYLSAQKEAGTPVTVAYPLATPRTYQLTPNEVKTILGENNVFANTGDVSVEYRADIKKYIDKVVATAVSALS